MHRRRPTTRNDPVADATLDIQPLLDMGWQLGEFEDGTLEGVTFCASESGRVVFGIDVKDTSVMAIGIVRPEVALELARQLMVAAERALTLERSHEGN